MVVIESCTRKFSNGGSEMREFKARCSKLNHIKITSITDKQLITLDDLSKKEKLTVKQNETLIDLKYKRDNPEISQGTKTYCKKWLKEQTFKRRKEFTSKYTEKGNITEDNSIDFIADQLGFGMLIKNETFFSNEYFDGTPDVVISILVIDAKNSWDQDTFPLYETEIPEDDYYGQLQGYMNLTGKRKSLLVYILSDTPINIIEREAYFWCRDNGYEELDIEVHKEFIRKMTYNDIPNEDKIKVFEVEYDEAYIKEKELGVKLCREYIKELIDQRESEKKRIKKTYNEKG
jgi:hypothetical protein